VLAHLSVALIIEAASVGGLVHWLGHGPFPGHGVSVGSFLEGSATRLAVGEENRSLDLLRAYPWSHALWDARRTNHWTQRAPCMSDFIPNFDKLPGPEKFEQALGKRLGNVVWRLTFVLVLTGGIGYGAIIGYRSLAEHPNLPEQPASPPNSKPGASSSGQQGGQTGGTINNNGPVYNGPLQMAPPAAPAPNAGIPRTFEGVTGIPFEDGEVHGVLKSANEQTPANGCDGGPLSADALKILIGDNAIVHEGIGLVVPIGIRDCAPLSMERRPDGVFVNASLYDRENGAVVMIRDNRISALNGTNYTARQSRDESRLTIRNAKGTELFYVRFLNPSTIQFRGLLGCSANETVLVRENQPIPGVIMSGSCFSNARRAIQIGPETKKSP
jgi:hypothetical protein